MNQSKPKMRKEIIGDCTLYLADCRDVMAGMEDKSVDAVVTDPPYGVGGGSGTIGKRRSHKHSYESFLDTQDNVKKTIIPRFLDSISIAKGGVAVVTPGPKCLTFYPPPDAFGCLWQPATTTLNLWGRAKAQPIFYYGRPPLIGKAIGDSCYQIKEAHSLKEGFGHPCPKPLSVWKMLCHASALEGGTIFDPFMGSGTTGVACVELGRKFIGVEIEERYFDIACKRIDMAARQGKLF